MKLFKFLFIFISLFWINNVVVMSQTTSLVYPNNNFSSSDTSITFKWNFLESAINYNIEIAIDSNFTNIFINQQNINETHTTVSGFSNNQSYFWRVRGYNGSEYSDWSDFRELIIFNPNNLYGIQLWLSADTGIVSSNDTISVWQDQSPCNNDFNQNIIEKQATLINNGGDSLNNMPVVRLDGLNDYFETTNTIDVSTVFTVFNWGDNSTLFPDYCGLLSENGSYNRIIHAHGNSSNLYNSDLFGSNVYINRIQTLIFSPLYQYKMVYGYKNFKTTYNGIYIGTDNLYGSRYWKGNIAEIIIYDTVLTDTQRTNVEQYLRYKYAPPVNLGYDININYGFTDTVLNAGERFTDYVWSTGVSGQVSTTVNQPGTYSVTVTDIFGYESSDSIMVNYPEINTINDTTICLGDTLLWNTNLSSDYTFMWNDGSTDSLLKITSAGEYYIKVIDSLGNFSLSDTITVSIDSFPAVASLGNDTILCQGATIGLISGSEQAETYLWNTGSTDSLLTILSEGTYSLTATNTLGCVAVDSIYVTLQGLSPSVDFYADTVCFGDSTNFTDLSSIEAPYEIISWSWDFGDGTSDTLQNPKHFYTYADTFLVHLTAVTDSGCSGNIYKQIIVKDTPSAFFHTKFNTSSCINIPVSFIDSSYSTDTIVSWYWDFGDEQYSTVQNPTHIYSASGDYDVSLLVETNNSCSSSYTMPVNIVSSSPLPSLFTLVEPKNDFITNDTSLAFKWNSSENAFKYKLEISNDSLFNNIVVEQNNIYDNFINISGLLKGQKYFWKVFAFNICNDSIASNINSFQIFNVNFDNALSLWLKANTGIVSNNDTISVWQDQSQYNNDFNQNIIDKQAILINNGGNYINNMPVVKLDGINDYFETTNIINVSTVFAIFNWGDNSTLFPDYCGLLSENGSFNRIIHAQGNTSNLYNSDLFGSNIYINRIQTLNFSPLYQYKMVYGYNNFKTTYNGIYIGTDNLSMSRYWNGNIAEIIIYDTALTDTQRTNVEQYLRYKYAPPVNLGYDININYGFADTVLNAGERFENPIWSTGDTTQSITVNQSGTYSVTVTDIFGYESSDSLFVTYPKINSIKDTTICLGDTLLWNTNLNNDYSFLWNKGSVDSLLKITSEGQYYVKVTDSLGNFRFSDTISVFVDSFPAIASLGPDTNLCSGNSISLKNGIGETYLWSTGSTQDEIIVNNSGDYSVTVTNNRGCLAIDTVAINIVGIAPTPGFYFNTTCLGDTTFFTDTTYTTDGSNIISYFWDFTNGNYSSVQNPNFLFPDTGSYQSSLTVTTDNGCSNTKKQDIIIHSLPVINFSPNSACSNNNITFSDNSFVHGSDIVYREWHIEDSIYINEENPIHNFNSSGRFPVTLMAESNYGCANTKTQNIEIKQSPKTDFDFSPACYGDSIYFTDNTEAFLGSQITWLWNFGDETSSTISSPAHLFDTTGYFLITLTTRQLSNGCSNSAAKQLTVYQKPVAYFNNKDICINQNLQLIDSSTSIDGNITYWQWILDTLGYSYIQNPNILINDTGTYHIKLKIKAETGCTDTISRSIIVHSLPKVDFDFNPKLGAPPLIVNFNNLTDNATTYIWNFGDEQTNINFNPVHTYTDSGYYSIKLIGISNYGCIDSISKNLKIIIPLNDIAIMDIHPVFINNYLSLSADIANLGTLPASNFNLIVTTDNGNVFKETFDDELASGSIITYNFKTQIKFPLNTSLSYVCVKAELIGDIIDGNLENNEKCYSFKDAFMAFSPYPNPSKENINFEYIIPYNHQVDIYLYNSMGEKVRTIFSASVKKGVNKISINTTHLGNGIFTILVIFDGQKITKRFINSSKR